MFAYCFVRKLCAACIGCRQRYYGKSLPFGNDSFKHPYVDLLTAEQALADYAVLITALKTQANASDSRVIAFGGRYVHLCAAYVWLQSTAVSSYPHRW